jgi:hypothetical protein
MDLKNTNELLSAQEVQILKEFQMEELESRLEMKMEWRDPFNGQFEPPTPPTVEVQV